MEGAANATLQIQTAERRAQLQAAANAASRLGSDRSSKSDSGSATPPDLLSSEPFDEEQLDPDDAAASESECARTAERGAVLLAQHAEAADRARQRRATAVEKGKGQAQPKEAAPATKRASRRSPLHHAGSIHAIGHSKAKQAAAIVKLDRQVRFHEGPQSDGGKRVDVAKTTVDDLEVPRRGVCLHTKSLRPSRSKGLANAAMAASNMTLTLLRR